MVNLHKLHNTQSALPHLSVLILNAHKCNFQVELRFPWHWLENMWALNASIFGPNKIRVINNI